MKTCTRCGLTKSLSDFHKHAGRRDGVQIHCKACKKEVNADYFQRTKDIPCRKASRDRRRAKTSAAIDALKDVPCTDCGGSFPSVCMDFDHLQEKVILLSNMRSGYAMVRILEEAAKCEVVCANCHRIRTQDRRDSARSSSGLDARLSTEK